MSIFAGLLLSAMVLSLISFLCAPESSADSPLVGFIFSVTLGFLFIGFFSFLIRCCKCVCGSCSSSSHQTPQATGQQQQTVVVYDGPGEIEVAVYTGLPVQEPPTVEASKQYTAVQDLEGMPDLVSDDTISLSGSEDDPEMPALEDMALL